jgi:drug/metabolite transporter (DMT)-like permease
MGTVLNTVFYVLFLAALSWTDVTVALPMTAIEYGFAAFLAVIFLKEQVSPVRWAGIVLVIIGVIFIARGGGET